MSYLPHTHTHSETASFTKPQQSYTTAAINVLLQIVTINTAAAPNAHTCTHAALPRPSLARSLAPSFRLWRASATHSAG